MTRISAFYDSHNRFNPSAAESQARYSFAAERIAASITDGYNLVGDLSCGIGESTSFLEDSLTTKTNNRMMMVGVDIDQNSINEAVKRGIRIIAILSWT